MNSERAQDFRMQCLTMALRLADKNNSNCLVDHPVDETLRVASDLMRYVSEGSRKLTWMENYRREEARKAQVAEQATEANGE